MKTLQFAIVGSDSLLGAELRDVLSGSRLGGKIKLIGSEEPDTVILSERGGEPAVITGLDEENLNTSEVIFFAGRADTTRKAMPLIDRTRRPILIDLSGGLEDLPEARLRTPIAEPQGYRPPESDCYLMAHPAASMLALVLGRLSRLQPVARAVAQVIEPASELGRAGVDELQQQTISLLSFKPVVKRVFDAQLSFNLLAEYGSEAIAGMDAIEQRIERHTASLVALYSAAPMPSLRLLQAPVMHGYSISLWVEMEGTLELRALHAALEGEPFDLRGGDVEAPNVVDYAGQSGICVGSVRADRNNRRAWWLWLVADNFRLAADDAVAVARARLPGSSPR